MKFLIATAIGIAVGVAMFLWSVQAALNDGIYTSLVWQEIEVPNAVLGFEHSAGYNRDQDFFWGEIIATKAFKIELLKDLGHPVGGYVRNDGLFLPALEFKHTRKPHSPPEEDARLFLGIRKQFLKEPYTEIPQNVKAQLEAATGVFIREIEKRGVPSARIGDQFVDNLDFDTPQKALKRWGYKVIGATVLASWLTLALSLKTKRSNKTQVATP